MDAAMEVSTQEDDSWKQKYLLVGAVLGALTGLGAAYLMVQRADREHTRPDLGAGEGVRLGILLLGLLRQIAVLGDE